MSLKYNNIINPALVLEELNTSLWERHTGRMFVTLIYGIFSPRERKVILTSSAHPYPFLYENQKGQWRDVELDNGVPVGVVKETKYNNNEIYLNRGDVLVLLTDGLTETVDAQGNLFIPAVLSKLPVGSDQASVIGESLIRELNSFTTTPDLFDDATLLIIKSK
ncbi:MAG: serine/threonine-protein phosphatase [Deltaproteobacteria bacterium]|nr:serine/threonine-protein phosphatase [Deltaproteobacteria bacterium]